MVITKDKRIEARDLPKDILNTENGYRAFSFPHGKTSLKEMVGKAEMLIVEDAIRRYGSQRKAARALNVNQSTLVRKAKKYGICSKVISHPRAH